MSEATETVVREALETVVRDLLISLLAVCDVNENDSYKVGFIRAAVKNALKELGE